MKKLNFLAGLLFSLAVYGQSVMIVPNTENYNHNGIVYDNALFFAKNLKLVKFDGQSIVSIPEPTYNGAPINGDLRGNMVVYDNKLCYKYSIGYNDYLIAYNNSGQTAFKNPSSQPVIGIGNNGSESEPVISGNKLFLRGSYWTGNRTLSFLYVFDGLGLTMITNFGSNVNGTIKLGDWAVSHNNELYLGYYDSPPFDRLIKFNGTGLVSLTDSQQDYLGGIFSFGNNLRFYYHVSNSYGIGSYDPSGNALSIIPVPQTRLLATTKKPIVLNSKIYAIVNSFDGIKQWQQLAIIDGTNVQKIDNVSVVDQGPQGKIVPFAGSIYFRYKNSNSKSQLGTYSGTAVSLISNPSNSDAGIGEGFMEFNGNLFFTYKVGAVNYLAKYDGQNMAVLPNPDSGEGVTDKEFVVYGNDLYFPYKNAAGVSVLAKYGTTQLSTLEADKKSNEVSVFKDDNGFSVISKTEKIAKVEVLDASGRKILNTKTNTQKYSFEIGTHGVFIVNVTLDNGKVSTLKVKN